MRFQFRVAALAIFAFACDASSTRALSGRALIDGVADHSGIVVTLAGPTARVATTGADGRYAFDQLVPGRYAVIASADGTREGSLTAATDSAETVPDLVFHAVGAIRGHVTRGAQTSGNESIVVLADGSSAIATTDDAGDFVLRDLALGTYELTAVAEGFLPGHVRELVVERGGVTVANSLSLVPTDSGGPMSGSLSGKARVPGSDDASNIKVEIEGTSLITSTDASGAFTFPSPPVGLQTLQLTRGAYSERVPAVLATPGSSGFLIDGTLYPLGDATIVLARGTRGYDGYPRGVRRAPKGDAVLFRQYEAYNPYPNSKQEMALYVMPASSGGAIKLADRVQVEPIFSLDGDRIIYAVGPDANQRWDVYSCTTLGADLVQLATAVPMPMRLTSDGSAILFGGETLAPNERAYVVPADGGALTELADPWVNTIFVRPTTGALYARTNCRYTPSNCDLALLPMDGSPATTIATGTSRAIVASDGKHAVYSQDGAQFLHDFATGVVTELAANTYPAWFSSDGSRVFFFPAYDYQDNVGDLHSLPVAGGASTLLASAYHPATQLSSPSGALLYYVDAEDRTPYVVGAAGGPPVALGANAGTFQLSPRQEWISLFVDLAPLSGAGTLFVGDVESGELHFVASNVQSGSLVYSPDETSLAYLVLPDGGTASSALAVEVQATAGGEPTRLTEDARWIAGISPSGADVLYLDSTDARRLMVVPASGATEPTVLAENLTDAFFLDSETILLSRNDMTAPLRFGNGLYRLAVHE